MCVVHHFESLKLSSVVGECVWCVYSVLGRGEVGGYLVESPKLGSGVRVSSIAGVVGIINGAIACV